MLAFGLNRGRGSRRTHGAGAGGPRRRLWALVALVGGGLGLATLGAAVALALPGSPPITVTVHPKVTPDRAGTPAHPQGVRLDVRIDFGIPLSYNPPLVKRVQVWFPHGGLYEGDRYTTCAKRVLVAVGPHGCPRAAIMGSGVGDATADRTRTYPKITVVNGGQRVVYFYVVLTNPALVQEPLPGIVTKLSGRWSYRLSVAIPRNLQIVAGIPLILHSLHIVAGHATWLSTTSCPADHRWPWQGLGTFTNGQRISAHGAVACRN